MIGIPNARNASVAAEKITEYLLLSDHPAGHGKAEFFFRFGFAREAPGIMRASLLRHAREGRVDEITPTPFGTEYALEGPLHTPDGRDPIVRTVWLWRTEEQIHLITAYPSERRRR